MNTHKVELFKGWSYPIVVAHYQVFGQPDSWDVYGERHVVIETGEVMPEYRDIPLRRAENHVAPFGSWWQTRRKAR